MEIRVGKIDRDQDRCDVCGSRRSPFRECVLPYGRWVKSGGQPAQYWDLCDPCIATIKGHSSRYVTLEAPLPSLVAVGSAGAAERHSGGDPGDHR